MELLTKLIVIDPKRKSVNNVLRTKINKQFLVFGLTLLALVDSSALKAESKHIEQTSEFLLPLVQKAISSLEKNPAFYPHGMGHDPYVDIPKWLHKNGYMGEFDQIPLDVKWQSLEEPAKTKFISLIKRGAAATIHREPISYSEHWMRARANNNLNVTCCGNSCYFDVNMGEGLEKFAIRVVSSNNSKSCRFSWSWPASVSKKLTPEQSRSGNSWIDPDCSGRPDFLASSDSKAAMELTEAYKKLLGILKPDKSLIESGNGQCDL